MDQNKIDDEMLCKCALCEISRDIVEFFIKNYIKFMIESSVLQLIHGFLFKNKMIYIFGYLNLTYISNLLKYKYRWCLYLLIPIYFLTMLEEQKNKFPLINNFIFCMFFDFVVNTCVIIQVIIALIRTVIYIKKLTN